MFDSGYVKYNMLACYSEIFGQKFEQVELEKKLATFDIKLALALISRLISLAWAVDRKDIDAQKLDNLIMTAYRCRISLSGGNITQYDKCDTVYCPQTLYVLMKCFLAYSEEIEPLRAISLDDIMFVLDLALVINDWLPKDDIVGNESDYLFVNLYHNTPDRPLMRIGRGYFIYDVLARENPLTRSYIELFEKTKGYTLPQLYAEIFGIMSNLLCNKWDIASFCSGPFAFNNKNPQVMGLANIHQRFIENNVIRHIDVKKDAQKTLDEVWNFELFYLHPLISVGDLIFSISETTSFYLLDEGLYWSIKHLQDDHMGRAFMCNFGTVFEEYIKRATNFVLKDMSGLISVLLEFEYIYKQQKNGNRKSTDVYIRRGTVLLAIEAKAESLHSSILKGYNRKQMFTEVDSLLTRPIKQVDRRLLEILSDDVDWLGNEAAKAFFTGVDEVYIICVSREHLIPIGELLLYADARIHEDNDCGEAIKTAIVKGYYNLSVNDYEALLQLIIEGIDISKILSDWNKAIRFEKLQINPFSTFINSNGYDYKCPDPLETMFCKEIASSGTQNQMSHPPLSNTTTLSTRARTARR